MVNPQRECLAAIVERFRMCVTRHVKDVAISFELE
jgi:hypothetical protein